MNWNMPIFTFLTRNWLLIAFVVAANLLCQDEAFFQKWGAIAYIPAISSTVMLVALFCIHLFFRETVDKDVHDGTYVREWRSLTPAQRVLFATIIRIGIVIGFCILCAGLARGAEPDQLGRWRAARINPKSSLALDVEVSRYVKLRSRYLKIEAMRSNGVPAPIIFCLHQRESSGSFLCHPHEGSPLTHRTRYVPKGRLPNVEPPYTFEQSAEDAYYVVDRLDLSNWCEIASRLQAIESFNGLGYQKYHADVPSPYLWSGTNIYERGKYTGDGRFDRLAIDKQLGVAAILKRMEQRGIQIFCSL